MGSLTVIKPGLLSLLQDRGRPGLAFYAIPRSGPLDPQSAELASALLGNKPDAPTIECHFVPPTLQFETAATICLTGADMHWQVGGRPVERHETLTIPAGSQLSGAPAQDNCRAYIAIRGLIQTDQTFGSAACYALGGFGGNGGKPFAPGDTLAWQEPEGPTFPLRLDVESTKPTSEELHLLPGPEFDWLTKQSQMALQTETFTITADSDRMGARLHGPPLTTASQALAESVPLLPGFVQLPPSGQLIVVLQDGQTTGGYPRIGFLCAATLCQFNQIPLGQGFGFQVGA
ncbi:MAG: biotin-dependent carboxyltransferase family protein [Aeoliella sp.]